MRTRMSGGVRGGPGNRTPIPIGIVIRGRGNCEVGSHLSVPVERVSQDSHTTVSPTIT